MLIKKNHLVLKEIVLEALKHLPGVPRLQQQLILRGSRRVNPQARGSSPTHFSLPCLPHQVKSSLEQGQEVCLPCSSGWGECSVLGGKARCPQDCISRPWASTKPLMLEFPVFCIGMTMPPDGSCGLQGLQHEGWHRYPTPERTR